MTINFTAFGLRAAAAAALFCGVAQPAAAALLKYDITGQGKFVDWGPTIDFTTSFQLDTATLALSEWGHLDAFGLPATLGMSPFYMTGAGVMDVQFYAAEDGGGVDLAFQREGHGSQGLSIGGAAFFTGPLTEPVFQTGTWTGLPDYFLDGWSYNVSVTAVETPVEPQPVPEPAALTIMALGTAMVGGATRRRRRS